MNGLWAMTVSLSLQGFQAFSIEAKSRCKNEMERATA